MKALAGLTAAVLISVALAVPAQAGAIRNASLFTDNTLTRNDDGSAGPVNIGFDIDFFGLNTGSLIVNNNGNVTFTGPLSTFTPFSLLSTSLPIIAPFFADVDTTAAGSGVVQYGQDTLNGRKVFGVNWINVGYFSARDDKLNSFQLIITERADIAPGAFDFEFNYDRILWETGSAQGSNGTDGLGGNSARAGWSNGTSDQFELAGSAINGAFLDGGPNALISSSLNSTEPGRYIFFVRNGSVEPTPDTVPEPGSLALLGAALVGAGLARRKQRA